MGTVRDFFYGTGGGRRGNSGMQKIEHHISQIGWTIDERLDDDGCILKFPDSIIRERGVRISTAEADYLGTISTLSGAAFEADALPSELGFILLLRNKDSFFGGWHAFKNRRGKAMFALNYAVLLDGLTTPLFKVIIQNMVKEANEFDQYLRSKRYL